jgi:hypothetical protein
LKAEIAGRFAREALERGEGVVCALFRRSFYLQFAAGEASLFACVGDASLGKGPLNVLVRDFSAPELGQRMALSLRGAQGWSPPAFSIRGSPSLQALEKAAQRRAPAEGLGCLIGDGRNALSVHAQPALDSLAGWLSGNALGREAEALIGLGPGLTPSGDDYLGGMLIALRACGRPAQVDSLWSWLAPRLPERTSAISAAHVAAAAAGEAHEALHYGLEALFAGGGDWDESLTRLDGVGHSSGWDALAGAVAVARTT